MCCLQLWLLSEARSLSGALPLQPTVHFTEDTLIRSEDEDEDEK